MLNRAEIIGRVGKSAAVAALARESIAIGDLYVRAANIDRNDKIPLLEDK